MVIRWVIVGTSSNTISMTDWTRFWRPTVSNDDDEHRTCALITCKVYFVRFWFIFTDLDEDGIAAVRDAKIVTTIEVSEGGEVRVATSDAESEGEANIVTFTPATETNITNPLNGETVAVSGRGGDSGTKKLNSPNGFPMLIMLMPVRGHRAGPHHAEDQVARPRHQYSRAQNLDLWSQRSHSGKY